jgi:hypothetical protein
VLDFLDLSGADGLVKELNQEESFRSHGSSSSPAASIGRWRDDLSSEELAQIEAGARALMARCGYVISSDC